MPAVGKLENKVALKLRCFAAKTGNKVGRHYIHLYGCMDQTNSVDHKYVYKFMYKFMRQKSLHFACFICDPSHQNKSTSCRQLHVSLVKMYLLMYLL